jgi:hypothetical protein
MIRCHIITLWLDGQLWHRGFLDEPAGTIRLYASSTYPMDAEFTVATLPAGVKVCPSLALTLDFAPKRAQDEARAAILRYGYEVFEVDIVPW